MTVFQMRMDNDVAPCCSAFYRSIEQGAPLNVVQRNKQALISSMRENCSHILKVQGIATAMVDHFLAVSCLTGSGSRRGFVSS